MQISLQLGVQDYLFIHKLLKMTSSYALFFFKSIVSVKSSQMNWSVSTKVVEIKVRQSLGVAYYFGPRCALHMYLAKERFFLQQQFVKLELKIGRVIETRTSRSNIQQDFFFELVARWHELCRLWYSILIDLKNQNRQNTNPNYPKRKEWKNCKTWFKAIERTSTKVWNFNGCDLVLKFVFPKMATKIAQIVTVDLTFRASTAGKAPKA